MKVITLQGIENSGKTEILNKVINKLTMQGYSITAHHTINVPAGDRVVLLQSLRTKVAVVTIGDPDKNRNTVKPYTDALQWCLTKNPEYVICGSREKDGVRITLSAIKNTLNISDRDIRYIRTDKIGTTYQAIENDQKAESILRHLDDLISGTPPLCP